MDEQGIVDLVTAPAEDMHDEEDADENAELSNRKEQCPVSHADAMRMFDDCLTWLRFQQEATVSNTSTLDFASWLLKNVNLCEDNPKLIHFLGLLLQVMLMMIQYLRIK